MNTLRQLYQSVREFRKPAFQTPFLVIGEVIFEALIPYTIAMLVNEVKAGGGIDRIMHYAWILLAMSMASLLGAFTGAPGAKIWRSMSFTRLHW